MTGRPSKYTPELFDEICERISKGETLASICRDKDIGYSTVHEWVRGDEDLSSRFARARDKGFDAIAEDTLRIIDEPPPSTNMGGTDSGHVAWAKARVETRLKLLAKWDPKRYGDKLDLNHSGEVRVNRVMFVGEGSGGD